MLFNKSTGKCNRTPKLKPHYKIKVRNNMHKDLTTKRMICADDTGIIYEAITHN